MQALIAWIKRNKELVLYVVFGGLTTLVNIVVFWITNGIFGIHFLWANAIAWTLAVLFSYITNKLFVFETRGVRGAAMWREFASFIISRLISLGIDQLGMWLMVDEMCIRDRHPARAGGRDRWAQPRRAREWWIRCA